MSAVNTIAATQLSAYVTQAKPAARQTATAPDAQPAGSASSQVSLSLAGRAYAAYEQQIAAARQSQSESVATASSDPQWGADLAYGLAHDHSMAGDGVGGLLSPDSKATDPSTYASGAPVTVASQAYFKKQYAAYRDQVLELYDKEQAKGTAPGQIVSDIYALRGNQPAALRAMMMWPPAAAPSSIETASNPTDAPSPRLYGNGQIANS